MMEDFIMEVGLILGRNLDGDLITILINTSFQGILFPIKEMVTESSKKYRVVRMYSLKVNGKII